MAVLPFGFVAHRCRCTLPRHAPRLCLPRPACAGYQRCGQERDAPMPGAEHNRVLGNDGAPHPLASLPERAHVRSPRAMPATARCSSPFRRVRTPRLHPVALARLAPYRSALHRRRSLCHARPSRRGILSAGAHVTVVTESHRRQAPCRAAILFWTFRRTPWQRPLSLAPRRCHTPGHIPAGSQETQRIPRINRFLCGVQGVKPDFCK
jgi:hypothetical protein